MFEAVHEVAGRGIADYPAPPSPLQHRPGAQDPVHAGSGPPGGGRPGWALRWPGMVVLLAAGVFWTRGVEAALAARRLPEFEQQCSAELRQVGGAECRYDVCVTHVVVTASNQQQCPKRECLHVSPAPLSPLVCVLHPSRYVPMR